jgi:hypothetical protein
MMNIMCFLLYSTFLLTPTNPIYSNIEYENSQIINQEIKIQKREQSLSEFLKDVQHSTNCTIRINHPVDLSKKIVLNNIDKTDSESVLNEISSQISCNWTIDNKIILFTKDYTRPDTYPDISLGEIQATAHDINALLHKVYTPSTLPDTFENNDFKALLQQMPIEQQDIMCSEKGILINDLTPDLQKKCLNIMIEANFGKIQRQWEKFMNLSENISQYDISVRKLGNDQIVELKRIDNQEKNELAFPIETPDKIIKEEQNQDKITLEEFSKTTRSIIPKDIREKSFFVTNKVVANNVLEKLAEANNWQFQKIKQNDLTFVSLNRNKLMIPIRNEEIGLALVATLPEELKRFFLFPEIGRLHAVNNLITKEENIPTLIQNQMLIDQKVPFLIKKINNMKKNLSLSILRKIKSEENVKDKENNHDINSLVIKYLFYSLLEQTYEDVLKSTYPKNKYLYDVKNIKLSHKKENNSYTIIYPDGNTRRIRFIRSIGDF